jgi:hypothetical protein
MYVIKIPNKALVQQGLIGLAAVVFLIVGVSITWKILSPDKPPVFLPGQQIVQSMTLTLSNDRSVLNSSGVYVPETGIFIYTQLEDSENFAVRQWASLHLLSFDDEFATLPDDESLVWLIDYGLKQEVVSIPLGISADPTIYEFMSLTGRPVLDKAQAASETVDAVVPDLLEETAQTEEDEQGISNEPEAVEITSQTSSEDEIIEVTPEQTVTTVPSNGSNVLTDFDGGDAAEWSPFAGSWEVIDGAYHQTDEQGFDLGSSLGFSGDDYSLTANVRYLAGDMGAGFYFNMTNPDSKNSSQMLNFTDGGETLQWGHFNEAGEFIFNDNTPVPNVADGEWHTLQLIVKQDVATIILNSEIVAEGIPLTYTSGYVGLLTSTSHVAFDDIVISPQGAVNLGTVVPMDVSYDFEDGNAMDWLAFAGDWVMLDGRYEQHQLEWDRISVLNNKMIGSYRFSSEMLHIEGDMGAGLIFNMQQRDNKASSHLISFTGKGSFLHWGSFDPDGVFVYKDGVNIKDVADAQWHELTVEVTDSTYAISLNGDIVASDIPLIYADGFVGLLDGKSLVAFDNVKLVGMAQSTSIDTNIDTEEVEGETTLPSGDEITSENESELEDAVAPELETIGESGPELEAEGEQDTPPEASPADDSEQGEE